jgi:rare lipoprotein A
MMGTDVVATADDATAQQADMPASQLASVWQGYFYKAFTPVWEPYTPLPKAALKPSEKLSEKSSVKPSIIPTQVKPAMAKLSMSKPSIAKPLVPDAVAATEATATVPVSATRQAILAQIMAQPSADTASDLAASAEISTMVASTAVKSFAKKDFQSAQRLGEPAANLFKPLQTPTVVQTGMASWYGEPFHGRKTSSGQRFDMHGYTAAHRTLPFGTKLKVTNLVNGRSVLVTVNDRGPFGHGRIIDLSKAAARDIGLMSMGVARVSLAKMPKFTPKAAPKLLPKKLAMLPPSKLGF